MWLMHAVLYVNYALVIVLPGPNDNLLSAVAPTRTEIQKPFETEADCQEALKAMVRYLGAMGRCTFEPSIIEFKRTKE